MCLILCTPHAIEASQVKTQSINFQWIIMNWGFRFGISSTHAFIKNPVLLESFQTSLYALCINCILVSRMLEA